jgi:hypothetical protein
LKIDELSDSIQKPIYFTPNKVTPISKHTIKTEIDRLADFLIEQSRK